MRTVLFLVSGLLLVAVAVIFTKLFSDYYPSTATVAFSIFIVFWAAISGFNMWVGMDRAGYTFLQELPIMLLIFGVPAITAILIRWKFF